MVDIDKIWSGLYREHVTETYADRETLLTMVCATCCAVVPAELVVAHNNWHAHG